MTDQEFNAAVRYFSIAIQRQPPVFDPLDTDKHDIAERTPPLATERERCNVRMLARTLAYIRQRMVLNKEDITTINERIVGRRTTESLTPFNPYDRRGPSSPPEQLAH